VKIREGFVSNSSSSAFVTCGSCSGQTDVGFAGHEDVWWVACEECETDFCRDCVDPFLCEKETKELEKWLKSGNWESMPKKFCPVCNLKVVTREDVIDYAFEKLGTTMEKLEQELLEKVRKANG
jgi:hypothetical protein